MINLKQIRDLVISPSLKAVDLHSLEAVDLLLYTGIQESRYEYIAQIGTGPARSFWQIEPVTMIDHYENYLNFRPDLAKKIFKIQVHDIHAEEELFFNMAFAVVMARLVYRRSPDPLPELEDGPGMAKMWKKVYNTPLGSGTEEEFIRNWERYKGDLL